MRLTVINDQNEDSFLPLMTYYEADGIAEDCLRIGVVDSGGYAAGALVARIDKKIIDIVSLYVVQGSRRRGYAKAMLQALIDLARPDEQTFISVRFSEDNELYAFFEAMGFELVYDMPLEYVSLRYVYRSGIFRRNVIRAGDSDIIKVDKLDNFQANTLVRYLKKNSLTGGGSFNPKLSTICIRGEEISSIMLAERAEADISILWMDFAPGHQKELLRHLNLLVQFMQADPAFNEESRIYFAPENRRFTDTLVRLSIGENIVRKDTDYFFGVKLL
ncbi:MAG: GNAT family N-acetyltransferase [Lachnospiraceae bacterium]|nr:GNAT family N-acetyltransferase [Lachnospiraceae bacterium]